MDLVLLACKVGTHEVVDVLLIRGKSNKWCLPGGKVHVGERIEDALIRETAEEVNLRFPASAIQQVGSFHAPGRDPRGRYVSYPYRWIIASKYAVNPVAGSDAKSVQWFRLNELPVLAYDHLEIIRKSVESLPAGLQAVEVKGES